MIRLGLTGSIGMGKTTTAGMFRDRGVPVWDADAVVHALYGPGGAAVPPLVEAFPDIVASDGGVDRSILRAHVAADPAVLDRVSAIVHPLVARDREAFLMGRDDPLVVLDVPLLFEMGLDARVDRVAVVSTDATTQRDRILSRGTMTGAELDAILSRQIPDADKRARADYVIDTSTPATARAMVDRIMAELT
ncbi:dephospho-CoA kinase [Jannaschia sp. LMIT008]|uniref:dephospho-CoA kinase n=1 Tax=Jannaschia maritima TaxID=3032585 RepID=UPI00281273D8|nr:dephospho-CoA kinase [Jannaschia sp. LMIT008]